MDSDGTRLLDTNLVVPKHDQTPSKFAREDLTGGKQKPLLSPFANNKNDTKTLTNAELYQTFDSSSPDERDSSIKELHLSFRNKKSIKIDDNPRRKEKSDLLNQNSLLN